MDGWRLREAAERARGDEGHSCAGSCSGAKDISLSKAHSRRHISYVQLGGHAQRAARPRRAMSILKGLLTAREGSYFKTEQEDDLAAYRRRRLREGALKAGALLEGEVGPAPHVSDTKLAEIHAQEARLSASGPGVRRSVSSQMPPMSAEGGYRRDRSVAGTYRIPSARNAMWSGLHAANNAKEPALLPEETAAMRKSKAVADKALAAGTRALIYGSLIAAAGVTGGALVAATHFDIRSQDDLRRVLAESFGPSVDAAKLRFAPYKAWLEETGRGGGLLAASSGERGSIRWVEDSAIVRDLRRKFRIRRRREPDRDNPATSPAEELHGGTR